MNLSDLVTRRWRLTISTAGLYFTLYFTDPSYFLVLPALRCCFGLDSSELSAELESSSTCNTVSDSRCTESLISQSISPRVFSEKPGDLSYSSWDREKRKKTRSPPAKPGGLAVLRSVLKIFVRFIFQMEQGKTSKNGSKAANVDK